MMAILTLYASSDKSEGGLGLSGTEAAALFGAYVGMVFVLSLPGGWIGDRVLGAWKSVLLGAVMIMFGHFSMAVIMPAFSYIGLLLISMGTGLLKPNMFALINGFYGQGKQTTREATISILYVSIQISALLAPFIVGLLAETLGWHWGFGAAGIGMALGVAQFAAGRGHFSDVGQEPPQQAPPEERIRVLRWSLIAVGVISVLIALDVWAGTFTVMHLVATFGVVAVLSPFVYYRMLSRNPSLGGPEKQRLRHFFVLLLSFSAFWMLAGQAGSMLSLFARESTRREVLGTLLPASWFQSAIPFFILIVAPLLAWLWLYFDDRITSVMKFSTALFLSGTAFVLMYGAALSAADGEKVSALWLITVFFLLACGEVIIGPVGLAAAGEVTSSAFAGRTIGLVWLFSALGAGLSSQIVHLVNVIPEKNYYLLCGTFVLVIAVSVAVFGRNLKISNTSEPARSHKR